MADSFARLIRSVVMLLLGVFVVALALFLLLFTLTLVLVSRVWGWLTGRQPSAAMGWERFQQSAASTVWRKYRASAAGPRRSGEPGPDANDVVDVEFKEVDARAARGPEEVRQIGR